MRQGLNAFEATGAELGRPYFVALLAEAYGNAGQPGAGLDVLDDGLRRVNETGERYHEAELHQIKGQLLLQQLHAGPCTPHDMAGAEACFHQAIAIACRQSAKSLVFRATLNLARLWQQQGKMEIARQTLAGVLEAIEEGRDTADWRQAEELLHSAT
jgi:predicted ATPase